VLKLSPLDSLAKSPDARTRGIAVHTVFERFIKEAPGDFDPDRLLQIARDVFEQDVDWPEAVIPELGFTLRGKADRIDIDARGGAWIYDYKTGAVPTKDQQFRYDMQLLLLAAMAQNGDFKDVAPRHIERAEYLGIGTVVKSVPAPLEDKPPHVAWSDLKTLLAKYLDPNQGFSARRAMEKKDDDGWYDHLSRYGEWDETDATSTGGVEP